MITANQWYNIAKTTNAGSKTGIRVELGGYYALLVVEVDFGSVVITAVESNINPNDVKVGARIRYNNGAWFADVRISKAQDGTLTASLYNNNGWRTVAISTSTPGTTVCLINDIMSQIPTGTGESLFEIINVGTPEEPQYAVAPKAYNGQQPGIVSKTFITFGGFGNQDPEETAKYTLERLNDVLLTTPSGGDVLTYDETKKLWVNQPAQAGLDEQALALYLYQNNYAKHDDVTEAIQKALKNLGLNLKTYTQDGKTIPYLESTYDFVTLGAISFGGFGQSSGSGEGGLTQVTVKLGEKEYVSDGGVVTLPAYPIIPSNISTFANDAEYATLTQVDTKIAELVNAAPETLDTLGEIASQIQANIGVLDVLTQSITVNAGNISTLQGYFTDGAANNALMLGGQNIEYFATATGLTATNVSLENHISAYNTFKSNTEDRLSALESLWTLDEEHEAVRTTLNLIIEKAISFGGFGQGTGGGGGLSQVTVKLGTTEYTSVGGVVSLPAYPSALSQLTNDVGYISTTNISSQIVKGISDRIGANVDVNTFANGSMNLIYHGMIGSGSSNIPSANGWMNGLLEFGLHTNGVTAQLYVSANGNPRFRNNATGDWNTIAYTTDNVASATKLANKIKIWGREFDGSADISGRMLGVSYITLDNTDTYGVYKGTQFSQGLNDTDIVIYSPKTILGWGDTKVLIGTNADSNYKVDINGSFNATSAYIGGKALLTAETAASTYLPKSGGTISGSGAELLKIDSSNASYNVILFKSNGASKSEFGFAPSTSSLSGYSYIFDYTSSKYLGIDTSGTPFFGANSGSQKHTLIHSGNYSSYALPLSGGTLESGNSDTLIIRRLDSGNPYITFYNNSTFLGRYGFNTSGEPIAIVNSALRTLIHSGNIGKQIVEGVFAGSNIGDANTVSFTDSALRWFSLIPSTTPNIPTTAGYQNGLLALPLHSNGVTAQLYFSATKKLYYRSVQTYDWNEIAYVTDNVAAAQSLKHSNGTLGATVESNGNIIASKYVKSPAFNTNGDYGIWKGREYTGALTNEDIAYYANIHQFYGNLVVTGAITFGSDARYKHRLDDVNISLEDIASAPLFNYVWTDREDKKVHLGTTAQYWHGTAFRNAVIPTNDEKLWTMSYSEIAMGSSIILARELLPIKLKVSEIDKIKEQLQQTRSELVVAQGEIKSLKQQLNTYRRAS